MLQYLGNCAQSNQNYLINCKQSCFNLEYTGKYVYINDNNLSHSAEQAIDYYCISPITPYMAGLH